MARSAPSGLDQETVPVPGTVRFPVELAPPEGCNSADMGTWPRVGLVGPDSRYVLVVTADGESRHGSGSVLPPDGHLPDDLFAQIVSLA